MDMRKIALSGVIALAVLAAMLVAVPSALASYPANCTYFVPEHSIGACCENNTIVQVRANTTFDCYTVETDIYFDPNCVNITAVDWTGSTWQPVSGSPGWSHNGNYVIIASDPFASTSHTGDNPFVNITLHCVNGTCNCISYLDFGYVELLDDPGDSYVDAVHNGTIDCTGAAGPINVHICADSITGNIFNAPNYPVYPGTVTEDEITINNQTAMGALVAYCQDNGINVELVDYGGGDIFVNQIGGNATDYWSWMYAVDESCPGYSAAKYDLSGGEFIHWFNYNLNYYTVLTTLDKISIYLGGDITATVTWKNMTGTYLLSGASVNVSDTAYMLGPSVGTTGLDGNCTFKADETGRWYVYAEHSTYGSGIYNYPVPYYDCLPEPEDLEITDIWTVVKVGNKFNTTIIYYNITNNGDAEAGRSVSNLTVDGIEQKKKGRVGPLAPGETLKKFFRYRSATPPNKIMVCADYNNRIAESNETNNCGEEPYL